MTLKDPAAGVPAPIRLRPLPYAAYSLEPLISSESVEIHYEQHQARYAQKANEILTRVGGPHGFATAPPRTWDRWVFNAHGAWLHELWWDNLVAGGNPPPDFFVDHVGGPGAMVRLKADLLQQGLDHEGSGWVFLSSDPSGEMWVHTELNHDYDSREGRYPLLVIDLWEHAYYLDRQNDRKGYLEAVLSIVNWGVVEWRLLGRQGQGLDHGR